MEKILLALLLSFVYSQDCVFPTSPDTSAYPAGNTYIIYTLPYPTGVYANVIGNDVYLYWSNYWSNNWDCYTVHFGYAPNPGDFCLYKKSASTDFYDAIGHSGCWDNFYVDRNVPDGEWDYTFMSTAYGNTANDYNQWSHRNPSIRVVVGNVTPPSTPVEQMILEWKQRKGEIEFTWTSIFGATNYKLSKAHKINGIWNYWWDDTITNPIYWDTNFITEQDYFCNVKAYKHNILIGESNIRTVNYYNYLEIDDEYWDAVEDYEEQKRHSWFGCQP